MKLLSLKLSIFALSAICIGSFYATPLFTNNGTSIIYANDSAQNGGKPYTIKLPDSLTEKQFKLLNFAYSVAKEDGIKSPQYLQGVIMTESEAGSRADKYRVSGTKNSFFGIGQINITAAKAVMSRWPDLWKHLDTKTDEELQARLILDDEFNIRVASKYLLLSGINKDATFAITAYNAGLGGATKVDPETYHYTVVVKRKTAIVENIIKTVSSIKSSDSKKQMNILAYRD